MTLNKDIFPWFNAILLALTLELAVYRGEWVYILAPMALAVVILSVWQFNEHKFNRDFWRLGISPILFFIGVILFFVFLVPNTPLLMHSYVILMSLLTAFYYKNIHDIAGGPQIYRPYALENLASHFNLLTIFLFSASFYNFVFFSGPIFWVIEAMLALIIIGLLHQTFWASRILNRRNSMFIFVIALIMAEVFLIVSYLPTGFYVSGLILTLIYYFLSETTRNYLLDKTNRRNYRREMIIAGAVLIIVLLTARWH